MPPLEWDPRTAMVVVMAANGYPGARFATLYKMLVTEFIVLYTGSYSKDTPINNVAAADSIENVRGVVESAMLIVGARWLFSMRERLVSTGGRVLGVASLGNDVLEAQKLAYKAVDVKLLSCKTC
eukprot:751362-Hanusia_phi.AAC.6